MSRCFPALHFVFLSLAAIVLPASRAGASDLDIVISEIHYNPLSGDPADEFVELQNFGPSIVNLGGWRFTEGLSFTFPPGTQIEPQAFLVVSPDAAHTKSRYAISNVIGDYAGKLDNNGEIITLVDGGGKLISRLHYGNGGPWPSSPDAHGPSLELLNPRAPPDVARSWAASLFIDGTPGGPNSRTSACAPTQPLGKPAAHAVINEVKPTEPGSAGFIELYNPGDAPLSLDGHVVLDSAGNRFAIPGATSVAPRGRVLFAGGQIGFALFIDGVTYVLAVSCPSGGGARFVDAVSTRAGRPGPNGYSFGRFPDGGDDAFVMVAPSPGTLNQLPAPPNVVINEIYFHPTFVPPGSACASRCSDAFQWIELYNRGSGTVDISGWSLSKAVDLELPPSTALPAGAYLVVAASSVAFLDAHPGFDATKVIGDWKKHLSHESDTIHLLDALGNRVSRVEYGDGNPVNDVSPADGINDQTFLGSAWPDGADGTGRTIELTNPALNGDHGASWALGPPGGTPGKVNVSFDASPPPVVDDVAHSPAVPKPNEAITVRCRVSAADAIESVEVIWHIEGGAGENVVALKDDGLSGDGLPLDGEYAGIIPSQPDGAVVAFQVRARLTNGKVTTVPRSPAAAPYPGFKGPFFLWQVLSGSPPANGSENYYVVLTAADKAELETRPTTSDILLPCTVISVGQDGGSEIRYLASIRYRGGSTREEVRKSFRIDFPGERRFHSIAHLNLNASHADHEIIVADLFRRADMPYPEEWLVNLTFQGKTDANYVRKEHFDSDFLSRFFGGSSNSGNLYRALDPVIDPDTGEYDPRGGDLTYYGPNPADYTRYYQKGSNKEENDYSDVIELCRVFDPGQTPNDVFPQELESAIDTNEWARFFAIQSFISNEDGSIQNRVGEDYLLYKVPLTSPRPDAGKWVIIPWDIEETLMDPAQGFYQYGVAAIKRFLRHPRYAPLFYSNLIDLRTTVAARRELKKHLNLIQSSFDFTTVDLIDTFFTNRIGFIDWNVPLEITAGPASGGLGCGAVLYATAASMDLAGKAPATATRSVRVEGALVPYNPVTASWTATVSLLPGDNSLTVEAFDGENGAGSRIESKTLSIRRLSKAPSAVQGSLTGTTHWTAADGPYLLAGVVTVPAGSRLEIAPGTVVFGGPDTTIVVQGEIQAVGTEDAPILFRPLGCESLWGGISLDNTGTDTLSPTHSLRHCDVNYAVHVKGTGVVGCIACVSSRLLVEKCSFDTVMAKCVDGTTAYIDVRDSTFQRCGEAVHAGSSTVIVTDSSIRNLIGDQDGIDFDFGGMTRSRIERCFIANGGDDGIDLQNTSADVRDNVITGIADKGFTMFGDGNLGPPVVTGNLIYDCGTGIVAEGGIHLQGDHNTVVGCEGGVSSIVKYGSPLGGNATLSSMIVWDNTVPVNVDSLSSLSLTYSDVGGGVLPGVGNISSDPKFVGAGAGNYALSPTSPCIATGEDGTDMGAVAFTLETRPFVRGDADASASIEITDAIFTLSYLFIGGPAPGCLKTADLDDNGKLEITDAVFVLSYLFLGARAPQAPFPGCGGDPTPDGLSCRVYSACH